MKSTVIVAWVNFFSKLCLNLAILLLVTRSLDVPLVNVWFLFSTIVVMSMAVQAGAITTLTRFVVYVTHGVRIKELSNLNRLEIKSENRNSLNVEELSLMLSTMKWIFILLGVVYFFVLSIVGSWALAGPISEVKSVSNEEVWIVWWFVASTSSLYLSFNVYQIFLDGIGEVKKAQMVLAVSNSIGFLGLVLFVWVDVTLLNVLMYQQAILFISLYGLYRESHTHMLEVWNLVSLKRFSAEATLAVWDSAWKGSFTIIIANGIKHFSGIYIANTFNGAITSNFLFVKRLFEIIDSLNLSTLNVFLPKVARAFSVGDAILKYEVTRNSLYLVYGTFIIAYVTMLLLTPTLVSTLGLNVSFDDVSLVIIFSFTHFILRWLASMMAIGHQSHVILDHKVVLIYAVVYIGTLLLYTGDITPYVFLYAMISGGISGSFFVIPAIYKKYKVKFFGFEKFLLISFFCLLAVINAIYYYSNA